MRTQRLVVLAGLLAILGLPTTVHAVPPWLNLFKARVPAEKGADYLLTENNGPWMIMAASFSGEGGMEQASELVYELRDKYQLEAYLFQRKFEYEDPALSGRVDRFGNPVRGKYRRDGTQEIAVIVGNYGEIDEPDAQKHLLKIKGAEPKSLMPEELKKQGRQNFQTLAGWRLMQKVVDDDKLSAQTKKRFAGSEILRIHNNINHTGPMGQAFLCVNPIMPKERLAHSAIDSFVYGINKGVKHSLLKCPGKFTVKVATFNGAMVVDQKKVWEFRNNPNETKLTSRLEEAAMRAHELTEALRVKGWEAYEFHDRHASLVTVGSFDSVGTPQPDGTTEINPEIYKIMQTWKSKPIPGGGWKPETLLGIPFDVQPIPVAVPRRSLAADYAGDSRRR